MENLGHLVVGALLENLSTLDLNLIGLCEYAITFLDEIAYSKIC